MQQHFVKSFSTFNNTEKRDNHNAINNNKKLILIQFPIHKYSSVEKEIYENFHNRWRYRKTAWKSTENRPKKILVELI